MAQAGTTWLDFVSSHGTGTPLGDPIETGALSRATAHAGSLLTIGAIKALFGHLEGTAGLAGLTLAVQHVDQRWSHALRYRNVNPYVASSVSGASQVRLPIQVSYTGDVHRNMRAAITLF